MSSDFCDFIFLSEQFNIVQPKEYFLNERCFGDDVALWLAGEMKKTGIDAGMPAQEQWGWYLTLVHLENAYMIAVSGNSEELDDYPNRAEWRVSVQKMRSTKDKLLGRNRLSAEDPIVTVITGILESHSGITPTGIESSYQ